MVRVVVSAAVIALAVAWGASPSRADGAVTSLGDLDGGAAQFSYIDPGAAAGTAGDAITNVRRVQTASPARETAIGEHLSVAQPLPPLHKPIAGQLWFARGAN